MDKPRGMSSAVLVGKARRLLNAAKAGHGGTLDPLATGLLAIAFGEATKTVSFVMDGPKAYRFHIRWGEARDTDDAEGAVTAISVERPTAEAIRAAVVQFTGDIEQVPPDYSAVKVAGRRAYALARTGEPVHLKPKPIHVARFELLGIPDPDHAEFEVLSGKGAYMRALARDLALSLGTVGHIDRLRRTRLGPYREEDAISLEKLEELSHSAPADEILRPVETALDDIPALALTETEARRMKQGQPVSMWQVARRAPLPQINQGTVICAMAKGKLVALARCEGGEIRPVRVLNL
jgi:tRNA pseudouridine55 synthase